MFQCCWCLDVLGVSVFFVFRCSWCFDCPWCLGALGVLVLIILDFDVFLFFRFGVRY